MEPALKTAAIQTLQAELRIGVLSRQRHLLPQQSQLIPGGHLAPQPADPVAQQVVAPGHREPVQRLDIQGTSLTGQPPVRLGQLGQQRLLLGAQRHAPSGGAGHGGPARLELGDKRLAQEIAVIAHILIALILHPAVRKRLGHLCQLGPADLKQGAQQQAGRKRLTRQYAGQAAHAGTTLEGQQQCLQLIVLMMGGEQPLPGPQAGGQPLIAGFPGLGLQALAIATHQLHPLYHERHRQLLTHGFTMGHPAIGVRAQAVMHVQGAQHQPLLAGKLRRQHQQHCGIEPATEGNQQAPGTFRRWQGLTKTRINTRNHRLPQNDQADLSRVGLIKLQPDC